MRRTRSAFLLTTAMQVSCGLSGAGGDASDPSPASPNSTTSSTAHATGSASTTSSGATAAPSKTPAYLPDTTPPLQQAHYIGRFATDANTGQMRFAWAGSTAEVNFTGTGLQARIGDANTVWDENIISHNILDVSVDGAAPQSVTLGEGLSTVDLVSDLKSGQHTARIVKRTEALVGTAILDGFVATQGNLLSPPADGNYRMIFYGVSNENGYGDLADVTAANMCDFNYATEDADKAYPALVAATLGMELTNISYSGKGIVDNGPPLYDPNPLPKLYDLMDPSDPSTLADFSGPEPTVVGIDLGGNDFDNGTPDETAFEQAYTQFLTTLRARYPHAPIICVMSPMMSGYARDDMGAWIQNAIASRNAEGDGNITFLAFDVYDGEDYGCNYHPTSALQASMAPVFEQQVREVTGL